LTKRIDLRFIGITFVILVVSFGASLGAIHLFRIMFPILAAKTFWDELTSLPTFAIFTYGAKLGLVYEQVFHLLIDVDVPGVDIVHIDLTRRGVGLLVFLRPGVYREALVSDHGAIIRNITWWGIRGVDKCILCLHFGSRSADCHYVVIPRGSCRPYETVEVRLSELVAGQYYVV
jgi:hypothetical protein